MIPLSFEKRYSAILLGFHSSLASLIVLLGFNTPLILFFLEFSSIVLAYSSYVIFF
jgi:hypothetical protein